MHTGLNKGQKTLFFQKLHYRETPTWTHPPSARRLCLNALSSLTKSFDRIPPVISVSSILPTVIWLSESVFCPRQILREDIRLELTLFAFLFPTHKDGKAKEMHTDTTETHTQTMHTLLYTLQEKPPRLDRRHAVCTPHADTHLKHVECRVCMNRQYQGVSLKCPCLYIFCINECVSRVCL